MKKAGILYFPWKSGLGELQQTAHGMSFWDEESAKYRKQKDGCECRGGKYDVRKSMAFLRDPGQWHAGSGMGHDTLGAEANAGRRTTVMLKKTNDDFEE